MPIVGAFSTPPEAAGFSGIRLDSGSNLYGHQLRGASGVLHGFDRILSGPPSHNQRQLTVGCCLDGSLINPQYVYRDARAATVYFHDELYICHNRLSFIVLSSTVLHSELTTESLLAKTRTISTLDICLCELHCSDFNLFSCHAVSPECVAESDDR